MNRSPEFRPVEFRVFPGILILLLVQGASIEASIHLAGTTRTGMEFQGRLAGTTETVVFIEATQSGSQHQIGVPLEDTVALQVIPDNSGDLLVELEACSGLLPYLTEASRRSLMERVIPLAKQHSWQLTYTWAERFANAAKSRSLLLNARLEKCQAMLKLGQFRQLESELDAVNKLVDPVNAPAMLCWLNARFSLQKDLPEEVRFWANLPFLQIPCYTGTLCESLRELADQAEPGKSANPIHTDR